MNRITKSFNPWYVGGGVKRQCAIDKTTLSTKFQSLVCWRVLKDRPIIYIRFDIWGFNPWYVGGGVKRGFTFYIRLSASKFQSLVCWRGC